MFKTEYYLMKLTILDEPDEYNFSETFLWVNKIKITIEYVKYSVDQLRN